MKTNILTQARLKELLHYDPGTGLFTWNISRGSVKAGSPAGTTRRDGYIDIRIDRAAHLSHRLAFLHMTGLIPVQVDHIDHIKNNNRWVNLRPADYEINSKNRGRQKNNKSGFAGVFWCSRSKKWRAVIGGKPTVRLGNFVELADAVAARKSAEIEYGYHRNNGAIL